MGTAIVQKKGGYSAQKRLAVTAARAEMAKQINVFVNTKLTSERTLTGTKNTTDFQSKIRILSKHESRKLIKNTIAKDEWINPENKELYVWVIIEKSYFTEKKLAEKTNPPHTQIVKNVISEGSCAVVGMRPEQSQLIALQRARAYAIEKAAGASVSSTTIVTNGRLAVDFINSYSKGLIINEKVEWLPLGQYQKDSGSAPIPEYRVKIQADVFIPRKKIKQIGLSAKLNNVIFRNGEKAIIEIKTREKARIGIFNITADDKIVMLFPNRYEKDNLISANNSLIFPAENGKIDLLVQTIEGHEKDAEAFFIVAADENFNLDSLIFSHPLIL